ncbi:SfnB family sulfur acquisition oxidoreductase [Pseudomonas aeruginosa]|nr:SfnB family sulfur acquisition oxidoreductase [Pseudomonas aeruginosa]
MTDETAPKDLRDQAPRLLPARLIENDAQALQAAHEVAGLARREAALRDRERRLPWQELELFTRLGLGGIGIPRAHGGAQVSHVTLAEVFRVICAADPALGQIPQNQFGLLSVIDNVASPAQKRKLFRGILDGRRLANAGPERNTRHTLELKARVRRDGDGYRVSGEKFYSTGALFAHWVAVKAIDEEERAVMLFVERGAPGLRIVDDWSGFGQRTTASGTVLLDEVPVAGDMLIPNGLLEKAGQVLDEVAARPVDAESAARASIAVAEAKVLSTEISLAASEKLFELAGSRATLAEFNLDRHWRNARTHTLHDPVRWKVHAVGDYYLNGARPARHSWI